MYRFERIEAPVYLLDNWEIWGERYRLNREANPSFNFQWPTYEGQRLNVHLKPLLSRQTQDHCSYCDTFPIGNNEESIDHFKPKTNPLFYNLVCNWENLYYSCDNCQGYKMVQFNESILRPDAPDFKFNSYFVFSFATYEIAPLPTLSEADLEKAKETIRVFGLNDPKHITARRISLERYRLKKEKGDEIFINDFPYRYIIID